MNQLWVKRLATEYVEVGAAFWWNKGEVQTTETPLFQSRAKYASHHVSWNAQAPVAYFVFLLSVWY